MPTSPTALPRQNAPKVSEYEKFARILNWVVYLAYGFFARLTLLGLWIFTDLLGDAFGGWIIAAIGFVLLPWTTLIYAFVWIIGSDAVSGWEWIVVGTALLVDYVFWAWSRSAFR
ncbi:MAG TPA: hypothetical protein VFY91_14895 [Microbacterium sp.]|nr:hypothetical protein [Microbacterium sp.]